MFTGLNALRKLRKFISGIHLCFMILNLNRYI